MPVAEGAKAEADNRVLHEGEEGGSVERPRRTGPSRKSRQRTGVRAVDDVEWGMLEKLRGARMPAGSTHRSFPRQFRGRELATLSDGGRWFLAFLFWRYRRQYGVTAEEEQYCCDHDLYLEARHRRDMAAL